MARVYTKTGWVDEVTPTSAANFNNMESGILLASAPIVTSLPTTPVDGQECNYLADATNGVMWHLVYRAVDAKWYYTGGPPLAAIGAASADQTTLNTWIAQSLTASLVVPLAGDYDVAHGDWHWHTANGGLVYQDVAVNGATAGAGTVGQAMTQVSGGSSDQYSVAAVRKVTGVPAGATLDLRTLTSSITAKIRANWMRVTPIRLG